MGELILESLIAHDEGYLRFNARMREDPVDRWPLLWIYLKHVLHERFNIR